MTERSDEAEVARYYEQTPEEDRLLEGAALLEALRTRELIERFGPAAPSTVIDIGGAAGSYALWLAERGHSVHLLDASPRLVGEARRRSSRASRPLASCEVGDARATPFDDAIADAVLLLGPLYHLTERADRVRALREAARVLKPGGRVFAAAISRWASSLDGLANERFQDPEFAAIVERDLRDGQHRNHTGQPGYFTTAYFHIPDELGDEARAAGLSVDGLFGIEGPGWLFPDVQARLDDARRRADLLRVARIVESESSLLGVSPHLLLVAQRLL